MSEATLTMKLLDEARDALGEMIAVGLRASAALVRRCGEIAEQLKDADVGAATEQLRAVAEAEDDDARLAAVFRALAAVKHTRWRLAQPPKVDMGSLRPSPTRPHILVERAGAGPSG